MRNYLKSRMTKRISRAEFPILLKRNRSSRGQALVEFTLVAMIFFLLAFAVIDFSWLLFNQMSMQDAVREAARYASTGQVIAPPTGPPLSRIDSIDQTLQNAAVVGTNIQS